MDTFGKSDWRDDPAAHHEWEKRYRELIIVPAAPVETEVDRGKFEPALWDINPEVGPAKREWESN